MFNSLRNQRFALWGLGLDHLELFKKLQKTFPNKIFTIFFDQAPTAIPIPENELQHLQIISGADTNLAQELEKYDLIITSPGVSLYRPEIQKAQGHGIRCTSATELWFEENFAGKKVVISGSKGKSTTATLISELLKGLQQKVELVGNIGRPLWSVDPDRTAPDYWVIELSSQQLAGFKPKSDLAVLTSLYQEHLDWHLSSAQYFNDKLNLIDRANLRLAATQTHSLLEKLRPDSLVEYVNWQPEADSQLSTVVGSIISGIDMPWLSGPAQKNSLVLAVAACLELGFASVAVSQALKSIQSFSGLAHRQEPLGKINNHYFVDDSISTIPEACLAAIAACKHTPITALVGGFDRGLDYSDFVDRLLCEEKLHAIICMPTSGERLFQLLQTGQAALGSNKILAQSHSLQDAVTQATKITPVDGTILLSPAAASFDNFQNYQERGQHFRSYAEGI